MQFGRAVSILLILLVSVSLAGATPDRSRLGETSEPVVRIGLYLPIDAETRREIEIGAAQALRDLDCTFLELVKRTAHQRWGGGAGEVAALIHEDGVAALLAPPDANEAHEVALVATRSRVPVMHLSLDPRLMNHRIPWFFRAVPAGAGSSLPFDWIRPAAYDGVFALGQALRQARSQAGGLPSCLRRLGGFHGVLGPLAFDDAGCRVAPNSSWSGTQPTNTGPEGKKLRATRNQSLLPSRQECFEEQRNHEL